MSVPANYFVSESDVVRDDDGSVVYQPILGGWMAEDTRTGEREFIYLNPSGGSDDLIPTVFLYQGPNGDPSQDAAIVHVVTFG